MGPRSYERGNGPVGYHTVEFVVASMGPRSYERGNGWTSTAGNTSNDKLQWGRVLMNAEMIPHTANTIRPGRLQWGRVLMNAEIRGRMTTGVVTERFNGAAFL